MGRESNPTTKPLGKFLRSLETLVAVTPESGYWRDRYDALHRNYKPPRRKKDRRAERARSKTAGSVTVSAVFDDMGEYP